jgi:cytochrome c oxidase subunit 1
MSDEKLAPTGDMAAEVTVKPEDIHLPPPSFWPIVLAFGFCCILGGLALNIAMTISGVIITLVAAIGWVIEPIHPAEEPH